MKKSKLYSLLKWLVLVTAYTFLAYKLCTYEHYSELQKAWQEKSLFHSYHYLLLVIILLPFNWLFETLKWKFLLRKLETTTIKESFKSVMIGNIAAFLTPNRLGEFPARSLLLSEGKKGKGLSLGIISSMSQTLTILIVGLPSAFLFAQITNSSRVGIYSSSFLILLCFLLVSIYFLAPKISNYFIKRQAFKSFTNYLENISILTFKELSIILGLSLIRFVIFGLQFYFLLNFFGVKIEPLFATIAIATNYLFITFTPSLAFSEGAIRASIAVLVIGSLSANTIGIIASGLGIWLINFVLPMLIGSIFFIKKRHL